MTYSFFSYLQVFLLLLILIFNSCKQNTDEGDLINKEILELYSTKYHFENEPIFEAVFDEGYKDTIYRYYWELDENKVNSYLERFNLFDKQSLLLVADSSTYKIFGVVFNRYGQIIGEGFFDEDYYFTGIYNLYNVEWFLIEKHISKLGQNFYEVVYKLDDTGVISDSTYKFFPIVLPDKDTFEGPDLTICFDIQIIIDGRKYKFDDFNLAYMFFDTKHLDSISDVNPEKDSLVGNFSRKSSDGYFYFCYDLEVKYHLMTGFGIFVDDSVSEQDLTFGRIRKSIINKNIVGTEL